MKEYCLRLCSEFCVKFLVQNNSNYFKFYCKELGCPFQVTYNLRDSQKSPRGYYLVLKATCLHHLSDCPYSRENSEICEEPKVLAEKAADLFLTGNPTTETFQIFLEKLTGNSYSLEHVKYIKKLAKAIHFNNIKCPISQLIDFCQDLQTNQKWKFDMEFHEGTLASIILFPPWAKQMIKYYCDPLITDATFS